MARIVAVDYGTRRVGLAIADPLRVFAQPLATDSPTKAVLRLKALHQKETIGVVVVGWPLMEDGSEGEATRRVNAYIRRLRAVLPSVEIVRWDERYTTEEARDRLRGRLKPGEKGRVDMAAAGIILQEYLDARETTMDD